MVAEAAQAVRADQLARRLRGEHLAAVPHRRDSRRAVDVDPDVALVGDYRFPGVDPHPDANRSVAERVLSCPRRRERIGGTREGDEERIALRVDLDAAVPLERGA